MDPSAHADFWRRWTPWRHGEPGDGNFADVMAVLRLPELFAAFAAEHFLPEPVEDFPVTVFDLGCGAAPMASRIRDALAARGGRLVRYVGVDFADPDWMTARIKREFDRHGLTDRATYLHHDLEDGLPAALREQPVEEGALLILSAWGITYLERSALRRLLTEISTHCAAATAPSLLCVNMLTEGQFDRNALTRKFLSRVVPRQTWLALSRLRPAHLREVRLAIKALPKMREFSVGLREIITLMPVEAMLTLLEELNLAPRAIDRTALWGQTTSLAIAP